MENKTNKFIVWAPRVIAIAFLCLLATFSFDVFSPGQSFWQMAGGFLIHNIPVLLLAAVIAVSWKRQLVGGVVFLAAGILFTVRMFVTIAMNRFEPEGLFQFIIAGPALLVGILFIIHWAKKRRAHADAR